MAAHVFMGKLARAAGRGDEEEVRKLAAEQNVNEAGFLGSAMHEASRRGHVGCVRILCQSHADVNIRDVTDDTPLHYAVSFGHIEVVKFLLESKADVNSREIAGGTPLHGATTSLFIPSNDTRQKLIEILMAAGADPSIRDKVGIGPADNSHVQRVSKAMNDRRIDEKRFCEMEDYILSTVPAHAEGPYCNATGQPLGPYGERLNDAENAPPTTQEEVDYSSAETKPSDPKDAGESDANPQNLITNWFSGAQGLWWKRSEGASGSGAEGRKSKELSERNSSSVAQTPGAPGSQQPQQDDLTPAARRGADNNSNLPSSVLNPSEHVIPENIQSWNVATLGQASVLPSFALKLLAPSSKSPSFEMDAVQIWETKIIPNWTTAKDDPEVIARWRQGIPPAVRGRVWSLAIGNPHNLGTAEYKDRLGMAHILAESELESTGPDKRKNRAGERSRNSGSYKEEEIKPKLCKELSKDSVLDDGVAAVLLPEDDPPLDEEEPWIDKATLRQINLDLDRTFPELGFFNTNGPYHPLLRDLLYACACHRPNVGYVQGMGYIASLFLLYMEPSDAFCCMAGVLDRHHFPDFLMINMERIDRYAAAFNECLMTHLPQLGRHLQSVGVDTRLYIVEWWMTIFGTILPIDAASVAWDLILLEGVSAMVKLTLGLLYVLQDQLINANLEICLMCLTHVEDWFDFRPDPSAESFWRPDSKSFWAALEYGNSLEISSAYFMQLVEKPVLKHPQDKSRFSQVLNQLAQLAVQDEEAATERRMRLRNGILDRCSELWNSAAAWTDAKKLDTSNQEVEDKVNGSTAEDPEEVLGAEELGRQDSFVEVSKEECDTSVPSMPQPQPEQASRAEPGTGSSGTAIPPPQNSQSLLDAAERWQAQIMSAAETWQQNWSAQWGNQTDGTITLAEQDESEQKDPLCNAKNWTSGDVSPEVVNPATQPPTQVPSAPKSSESSKSLTLQPVVPVPNFAPRASKTKKEPAKEASWTSDEGLKARSLELGGSVWT